MVLHGSILKDKMQRILSPYVLLFVILFGSSLKSMHQNNLDIQLMNALAKGNNKAVAKLLYSGASANATLGTHKIPSLLVALNKKDFCAVYLLLKDPNNKANPNSSVAYKGFKIPIAVFLSTFYERNGIDCTIKALQLLINFGMEINMPTSQGLTLLHYAVLKNLPELIQELLRHGANPNATNDARSIPTPFMITMLYKNHDDGLALAKIFIEHNKNNRYPKAHRVRLPLTQINQRSWRGETALDLARKAGNTTGIRYLKDQWAYSSRAIDWV